MKINEFSERRLDPFDSLDLIKRYFVSIGSMDKSAVVEAEYDIGEIMSLWNDDGRLAIRGKDTIGEFEFNGAEEIAGFYEKRTRGFGSEFEVNLSSITVANAKTSDHIVASGVRYMVTREGAGLQAPFTHNFTIKDGRIASLDIHVGSPAESEIAAIGVLEVEDMGRLSALAWMVA